MGEHQYAVARRVQETLQRYNDLKDIIAILGLDELSEEDKITVSRARKVQRFLSQPMNVAEVFTGLPGVTAPVGDTVDSFAALGGGQRDDSPEQALLNLGGAGDVRSVRAGRASGRPGRLPGRHVEHARDHCAPVPLLPSDQRGKLHDAPFGPRRRSSPTLDRPRPAGPVSSPRLHLPPQAIPEVP